MGKFVKCPVLRLVQSQMRFTCFFWVPCCLRCHLPTDARRPLDLRQHKHLAIWYMAACRGAIIPMWSGHNLVYPEMDHAT